MPGSVLLATSLAVLAASAGAAAAHSLDEVETKLGDREQYFQPIDRNAPPFTLEDADGGTVTLEDLRGKVVVLHGLKFEPTNLVVYVNALTHEHGHARHPEPSLWEQIRNLF